MMTGESEALYQRPGDTSARDTRAAEAAHGDHAQGAAASGEGASVSTTQQPS